MGEYLAENLRMERKIYGLGEIVLAGENCNFVDMQAGFWFKPARREVELIRQRSLWSARNRPEAR